MAGGNIQEVTFYTDAKGVRITNLRAIIGSRTYSMANVSSVGLHVDRPKLGGAIAMVIFGSLGALLFAQSSGAFGAEARMASCSGLLTVFFGWLAVIGIFVITRAKPKFAVRITAAGGESDALVSDDEEYIRGVVRAFNEAFVHRG